MRNIGLIVALIVSISSYPSSPAFAQVSVRGCCVDQGYFASLEARRLAADLAAQQRRWEASHPAPVVTNPTFQGTFERR